MPNWCEMWQKLGLNIEAHDQLLEAIPPLVQQTFLKQENRPEGMGYFDFVLSDIHGIRVNELQEWKSQGGKVIGTFCVYVPEEIILAAGGLCIGLCTGADVGASEAEKVLPRNLCPLIKSSVGFKLSKICPYFESCDLIVGETTCDGKKKAWEILADFTPVHVMQLPSMKTDAARALWLDEIQRFKYQVESLTGRRATPEALAEAVKLVNGKRRALQRLARARQARPSPISGTDALLIEQIAFYDDVARFTEKVNELCAELEERIESGQGVSEPGRPRLIISGTPMTIPNWKMPHLIETSGATVVAEESCTGHRYFREVVDEARTDALEAIADRYLKTDCACFTPNEERVEHIVQMVQDFGVDGVVYTALQFCQPYQVEYYKVKKALDAAGIPVIKIETDYGMEDVGQLKTRIEAFIEKLGERVRA